MKQALPAKDGGEATTWAIVGFYLAGGLGRD